MLIWTQKQKQLCPNFAAQMRLGKMVIKEKEQKMRTQKKLLVFCNSDEVGDGAKSCTEKTCILQIRRGWAEAWE